MRTIFVIYNDNIRGLVLDCSLPEQVILVWIKRIVTKSTSGYQLKFFNQLEI